MDLYCHQPSSFNWFGVLSLFLYIYIYIYLNIVKYINIYIIIGPDPEHFDNNIYSIQKLETLASCVFLEGTSYARTVNFFTGSIEFWTIQTYAVINRESNPIGKIQTADIRVSLDLT